MAGSGPSSQATLQKSLTGSATSRVHLGFDLYSGPFATSGDSNAVTFSSGSTNMTFGLTQGAQVSCRFIPFGNGVTGAPIVCPTTFTPNTWAHFDIDLTITGQTITVKITMPGSIGNGSFQATNWTGSSTLGIGSYPGSPQGFWEGYFDNVVVDMQ